MADFLVTAIFFAWKNSCFSLDAFFNQQRKLIKPRCCFTKHQR